MSSRRPPRSLLVLAFASAAVCLILAGQAIVTFPTAVLSAVCVTLYLVPPQQGVTRHHYLWLLILILLCAGATYYWQAAWAAG